MKPHRTTWLMLAAGALSLLVLAGCSPAPFRQAPGRHAHRTAAPPVTRPAIPAIDDLALERVVAIPTLNDTPSPSFSPDGRFVVYRTLKRTRNHIDAAQVHALELRSLEDRLIHEHEFETQSMRDPYGYQTDYSVQHSDHTYHPIALADDTVVMGLGTLGNPYDPYSTGTVKTSLDGGRPNDWGPEGAIPRSSPDGKRVLLQNANRMVEVNLSGQQLNTYTGFLGVYSPDGKSILAHLTPYCASDPGWINDPWPSEIAPPPGNPGGLMLISGDDEYRPLTEKGGLPTWHPDGKRFVFERPVVENYRSGPIELVSYDLQTDEIEQIAPEGRDPAFHPNGQLLAFEGPGETIRITDLNNTVDTGIKGHNPEFSPDGRLLLVDTPSPDSKRWREVAVYRLVARTETSDEGDGAAEGSAQQP